MLGLLGMGRQSVFGYWVIGGRGILSSCWFILVVDVIFK